MNWSPFLLSLGATLNAGGVATAGWLSTVLHLAGGLALYLAKSPVNHGAPPPAAGGSV